MADQSISGMSRIVVYARTMTDSEIDATTANGYVYFDLMDSMQVNDMETATVTCHDLADFTRLEQKILRGHARRAWVLIPSGELASPRPCTYLDVQLIRDNFLSKFGPNGIINKFDRND